ISLGGVRRIRSECACLPFRHTCFQFIARRSNIELFPLILTLGYNIQPMDVTEAASAMGRKSAEIRKKKWGATEFRRRLRVWGRGGREGAPGRMPPKSFSIALRGRRVGPWHLLAL